MFLKSNNLENGYTMVMNKELYSPQETSKILGVSVLTLQRWDKEGKITAIRTPSDRRRFSKSEINRLLGENTPVTSDRKLAIYARVSSGEQKKKGDLDRQVEYIKNKLDLRIYNDVRIITDVGSGLNDRRKGLEKLMELAKKGEITDIAIRYKDRLTRFGFNYLALYFQSHNVKVDILDDRLNDKSVYEELTDDLLSIVTSFSGRLYGTRSGKNKMLKDKVKVAIKDVANLPNED
jgi:excisionase family DNA binding protein